MSDVRKALCVGGVNSQIVAATEADFLKIGEFEKDQHTVIRLFKSSHLSLKKFKKLYIKLLYYLHVGDVSFDEWLNFTNQQVGVQLFPINFCLKRDLGQN